MENDDLTEMDVRLTALDRALIIGVGIVKDSEGRQAPNTDGSIVIKNAELFLKFLKGE